MTDLTLHGRQLETVFDLLGDRENDITYSLGWALAKSPAFCSQFLAAIFPGKKPKRAAAVYLQEHGRDKGYTDIEIVADGIHVIVEAKRGWTLPSITQLRRYARRLTAGTTAVVVLAECSPEYVRGRLPARVNGLPVRYLSWKHVNGLVEKSQTSAARLERNWLAELAAYLRGIMSIQDQESNLVYLLVLSTDRAEWSRLTWIEFVTKKRRYFHPYGVSGWPSTPPNYLGFRYGGQLRSIHHVDSYRIVDDYGPYFEEINQRMRRAERRQFEPSRQYFFYELGPPIRPNHTVKNGNIYANGRLWAALDLLLTSKTIEQACNLTKKRLAKVK